MFTHRMTLLALAILFSTGCASMQPTQDVTTFQNPAEPLYIPGILKPVDMEIGFPNSVQIAIVPRGGMVWGFYEDSGRVDWPTYQFEFQSLNPWVSDLDKLKESDIVVLPPTRRPDQVVPIQGQEFSQPVTVGETAQKEEPQTLATQLSEIGEVVVPQEQPAYTSVPFFPTPVYPFPNIEDKKEEERLAPTEAVQPLVQPVEEKTTAPREQQPAKVEEKRDTPKEEGVIKSEPSFWWPTLAILGMICLGLLGLLIKEKGKSGRRFSRAQLWKTRYRILTNEMKSQKQANGTLREELERVRLELSEMQTHAARADLVRETTGDPGLTIGCDVGPLEESPPSKERIM